MNTEEFRETRIRQYFAAWLQGDGQCLTELFADRIVYTECYGPEYRGLAQVKQWFADWQPHGQVQEWKIKRFVHGTGCTAVEWHFACVYDGQKGSFDGVSLVDFGPDGKILRLKEFESKVEHNMPYGNQEG
jgi:ketosteroid isomerase-like protein